MPQRLNGDGRGVRGGHQCPAQHKEENVRDPNHDQGPALRGSLITTDTKKADVAAHPSVLNHVGLLLDWPPGYAKLPFIVSSDSEPIYSSIGLQYVANIIRRGAH